MKLTLDRVGVRLRSPFTAAHGAVSERELLLVRLESGEGLVGYGEAAPLPSYDGASVAETETALLACRPLLADAERTPRSELLARLAQAPAPAPALAALDLALWDLEGKRAGQPVWRLLGAVNPAPVPVNWTIAAADRAGAAREAGTARSAGFSTLKAKVAIGDDAGRLAAVRAVAGPEMKLRIDANGAWSPAEAEANLRALQAVGIELCEEPVSGVAAIAALAARTAIPLALDESAADPRALTERACALVCLKVGRFAGISGLMTAARRARAAGYETFLASTLDGPLGIAAALHAAAALGSARACGLATLPMFASRVDPLPAHQGAIEVPRGAGLGEGLLSWYRAA